MSYKYKLVPGQENRQFIGGGVVKNKDGTVESPYPITSRFLVPIEAEAAPTQAPAPVTPPAPVQAPAPTTQPVNQETN
jgi:hypothetical protein